MSMLRSQPIAEQEKRARAWREQFVENAVANVRLEGADLSRSFLVLVVLAAPTAVQPSTPNIAIMR